MKLKIKLVLGYFLLAATIMVSISVLSLLTEKRNLNDELKNRAEIIANIITVNTEITLNQKQTNISELFLNKIPDIDKSLLNIKITDSTHTIIDISPIDNIDRISCFEIERHITLKNGKIINLHFTFGSLDIRQKYHARILYYIILSLIVVFAVVLLSIIISSPLIKPLKKLTKSVSKLDLDHLLSNKHSIARIQSGDEVEELSEVFIDMTKRLSESLQKNLSQAEKMAIYEGNLEEIVDSRTKKLNEVNLALKTMHERVLEELAMAKRVQENLLPSDRNFDSREEFHISSLYKSVETLGGDLYDIIRVGRNGYGFLIADVSGHGVAAALITTMVKMSFGENSGWTISPADVCSRVNTEMINLIGELSYFVTAFYTVLNLEDGVLKYTNAGHHPAILWRAKDKSIIQLNTKGAILGVMGDIEFECKSMELYAGDRILLFTDGIVETKNRQNKLYGTDRLLQYVKRKSHLSPTKFVDGLIKSVDRFAAGVPATDDRAILYVEFVSKINNGTNPKDAIKIEGRTI